MIKWREAILLAGTTWLTLGAANTLQAQGPVQVPMATGAARPLSESPLVIRDDAHLSFSDAAIDAFRRRVDANKEVAAAWAAHRREADRLLSLDTARLDLNPRRIELVIEPLILSYRVTGDRRYATKLHDILIRLSAQRNWVTDAPLLKRDPVWNSDLGMGFTAMSFGLAYDAIRETLSAEERKVLTDGLWRGVVEPVFGDWIDGRSRIHTLDTMGHNWWAHIVFGTGVGLAAIARDDDRALDYLSRLDAAAVEWWGYGGSRLETKTATFDADGGYSESLNYADLAVATYLDYKLAWTEMFTTGPAEIPLLPKAAAFFLHNAYPSSVKTLSTNFGDGNLEANGARTLGNLYLLGDRRSEYLWYLGLYDKADEMRRLPRYLVNLPLKSETSVTTPDLPTSAWYRGMGWATLRSSWETDATFLAVRSGFTWNHNHADAGSFILFHKGVPLLIDSGNSSYGRKEYDQYYRQGVAHNIVTFEGEAEAPEDTYLGSHNMGYIPNLLEGGGVSYMFADATGPTAKTFARNFRHFLWLDGVILVIDDLKAHRPGQFEWLLHPEGEAKRQGPALSIRNGKAGLKVQPLWPMPFPDAGLPTDYPENMRLETREGLKDHAPDVPQPYYAFVPAEKSERMLFINALTPEDDGLAPVVTRLDGKNAAGVRIKRGTQVTDVWFNRLADGHIKHRNSINRLGGYDTDAYLLAVSYDEAQPSVLKRLAVINGSYVRQNDQVLLDSLSKRFVVARYGLKQVDLWVQGQADARLGIGVGEGQDVHTVNGSTVSATRGGGGLQWIACCTPEP